MITLKQRKELYVLAKEAARATYSPYSKFSVGAAVLTKNGETFPGTNIENASYGLTICAERTAICNSVINGHKDIKAIAVYSKKAEVSPCGACRQFIAEFGTDIEVIFRKNGRILSRPIKRLLPFPFTPLEKATDFIGGLPSKPLEDEVL